MTSWFVTAYEASTALQYVGLTAAIIGGAFSLFAICDGVKTRRLMIAQHINTHSLSSIHMMLITENGILFVQCLLVLSATLSLALPNTPKEMHHSTTVMAMLAAINVGRVLGALTLLAISVLKVRWLLSLPRGHRCDYRGIA